MHGIVAPLLAVAVFATAARVQADTHVLVITGVAGDEQDAKQFAGWAGALVDAAVSHGVPAANVVYLAGGTDPKARMRSSKENVAHAFQDLAGRAAPDDQVIVVLLGHGSFDGRSAAFNLPGPDLRVEDYASLLKTIRSEHVAFVDTTGSSGAFLAPLAGPGRAVITATASGGERNDTRFPAYFVAAFADETADRDHDGRISLLEAFEYAKGKVADAYRKEGLLQGEHASLEDGANGAFAGTLMLGAPAAADADPALRTLMDERRQLELKVAALRQRKETMPDAQYESELENLLVQLATKTRAIAQLQGKK